MERSPGEGVIARRQAFTKVKQPFKIDLSLPDLHQLLGGPCPSGHSSQDAHHILGESQPLACNGLAGFQAVRDGPDVFRMGGPPALPFDREAVRHGLWNPCLFEHLIWNFSKLPIRIRPHMIGSPRRHGISQSPAHVGPGVYGRNLQSFDMKGEPITVVTKQLSRFLTTLSQDLSEALIVRNELDQFE